MIAVGTEVDEVASEQPRRDVLPGHARAAGRVANPMVEQDGDGHVRRHVVRFAVREG